MATRGPGAGNLSIGIHTAFYDRTPLIALVGLVPVGMEATGAFQDFEVESMFGSLAKRAIRIRSREGLERVIAEALHDAVTGRPGPVVIGLPTDVIAAMAPAETASVPDAPAHPTDVREIADLLHGASNPAFVMATQAMRGGCAEAVGEMAVQLNAPVVCAWRRFSAFDNSHPLFAGSLGLGMPARVPQILDGCDLAVVFGPLEQITVDSGRLDRDDLTVVVVQPGSDPHLGRRLRRSRVVQVDASPDLVAGSLEKALERRPSPAHGGRAFGFRRTEPLNLADAVIKRLDEIVASDAILTSDAGDFAHSILRAFPFDRDRAFVGPIVGAMGYGLPSAIGARLAAPERPVYYIAGDGGLLMTAGEMETAVRNRVDVTAIVFNNRAYGTIRRGQATEKPGSEFATDLGEVRFADAARAMGWTAWSARDVSEFDSALRCSEGTLGCRLIEVDNR